MSKLSFSKRLVSLLCAVALLVGMIPAMALTATAEMGGDFPWTSAKEQTLIEQILERDGLIDGIWFPWFDGGNVGHSLTGNETMVKYQGSGWSKVALDTVGADEIYQNIYNLKAMGYNLLGYGGSIYDEGVVFDDYGDVIGIKQEFLDNARRLLDMCREIGMPVMWTVCFHSSSSPGYHGMDAYNIFAQKYCNPTVTEHYVERFVRPLCRMLAEYKDILALVAIADEPENEMNDSEKGNHFDSRESYGVNRDDLVHFMSRINDVVKEELPDVARTVASNDSDKSIYGGFDMDLMGHNIYSNNCHTPDVEDYKTDAPIILTEYNVGHDLHGNHEPDYDLFTTRLIEWRENMMAKGYRGGVQWCWGVGGTHSRTAYYLLRNANYGDVPNTDFVPTVTELRHYMDDYRAAYRGETVVLDAPVLYCNEGGGIVEWIPSQQSGTKMDLLRSTDGGQTWKKLLSNVNQDDYIQKDTLKGRYTDQENPAHSMYKIVVRDGKGNTVESEPNNVAGVEQKYVKTTTYVQMAESGIGKHWNANSNYQLYSFGEVNNRPKSSSVNLIKSSGFETTGGQWNTGTFMTSGQVRTDSTAPGGRKALYLDGTGEHSKKWYTFEVAVTPYTDYVFSAWIKSDFLSATNRGHASIGVVAPDTGKFRYMSGNRASRDDYQIYPTAYDGEWHLRSVAFNSYDQDTVTIAFYAEESSLWIDDIALFKNGQGLKYVGDNMASQLVPKLTDSPTVCTDANNLVEDTRMDKTDFWQTGTGWRNGFLSVQKNKTGYGNSLKYTASSDPYGLYYIKWIPVEPNTKYVFTFDMKVLKQGAGKLVLLDERMTGPLSTLAFECDAENYGTAWKRYSMEFNSQGFTRVGIAVCDLGGSALYDNIRLFKSGKGVGDRDLYVTSLKKTAKVGYKETAKVTVNAKGDGLEYHWYYKEKGGSKFVKSSVTSKTYSTQMTEAKSGRRVYCVVKDKYGAELQTATTTLTMTKKTLKITGQARAAYAKKGATVKATVKASGDGMTYTWYYKNAGASKYTKSSIKTATYSTTLNSTTKNRVVYCEIKDVWGNKVTSKTITLRQSVSITTQPKTTSTKKGATAKATVKAAGDGLTYTWYYKNASASKFTKASTKSATYSVKMNATTKNRKVYCVVKDKWGNTVKTKTVTLREAVSVTAQPKTVTVKKGATAKTTVKASGDGLTYTWYYKNASASKFTKASTKSATYSVKMNATTKNRKVYCVVKDKWGNTVKTKTVTLKMK